VLADGLHGASQREAYFGGRATALLQREAKSNKQTAATVVTINDGRSRERERERERERAGDGIRAHDPQPGRMML
jgi:hypothetical protein